MAQIKNKFLAQIPANTLKGNNTGSTANVVDLTISQLQTMLSIPTSSSPLSIASGGTGQVTAGAAFNALNPMTTTGDMIYESATGVASRLPIGSTNQILTVVSGVPTWSTAAASGANVTLSNLTSPTAINQALLPDTDLSRNLGSATDRWNALFTTTVASGDQPINMTSGNLSAAATGGVGINSGNVTSGSFVSGALQLQTGSSTGASGAITINTGSAASGSSSGSVAISTATSTASNSGLVSLTSGPQITSGTSGTASISTGSATTGASSGAVTISSGQVTSGTGTTGSVIVSSGNATGGGNSGNVTLQAGTSSGTRGSIVLVGNSINASTQQIHNVVDPTSAQDAATKNYVDNTAAGLSWKNPVLVIATTNITLSGEQTIDGVLTSASRVLVQGQTTTSQNGIYVSAAGAWSRASDASTGTSLVSAAVFVDSGTSNAATAWVQVTSPPITIGTTSIVFTKFSAGTSVTYGNGLQNVSNVVSVQASDTSITSAAGGISVHLNAAFSGLLTSSGLQVITDGITTKINGSNQVEALTAFQENLTLSSGDITAQFKDLAHVSSGTSATVNSIVLAVSGGPIQLKATDYTISLTGGSGGVTRITFAGDLATGGNAALIAGDILMVSYSYLA